MLPQQHSFAVNKHKKGEKNPQIPNKMQNTKLFLRMYAMIED